MFWPFKSRTTAEPCFQMGQYKIDTSIDPRDGFEPLSDEELALLNPDISFEGEQILHAPDAHFMDYPWGTVLGVVHGEIYKVAIQWTGPRAEVGRLERQIKVECKKRYGKGERLTVWDASDGNIIVYSNNFGSEAVLTVTVTSWRVRQFKRVQ
jgi:hypothetical protein